MAKENTLKKIHQEILDNDLGKARDRLHGLLISYPDDLQLRKMLGDIYWQMLLPDMAGRYWYLEEQKDEKMLMACRRFEKQFKQDPMYMLFAIKFKGDLKKIEDTFAGETLMRLHLQAKEKYYWYEHFQNKRRNKYATYQSEPHKIWGVILYVILIFLLSVFCIGGITIFRWIFRDIINP